MIVELKQGFLPSSFADLLDILPLFTCHHMPLLGEITGYDVTNHHC